MLTEAGEALRLRAGSAFDKLDGALLDAGRSQEELTGLLRITAPIAFGTVHLAPMLTEFMDAHPPPWWPTHRAAPPRSPCQPR